MSESFVPECFLSDAWWARLCDLRVTEPAAVTNYAQQRPRRASVAPAGKLVILAADHPGRLVTSALGDPLAMADRRSYLARILRVMASDQVDGLMGTPDILEEALAADLLLTRAGQPSFLAGKLLIGCMNRGGLAGTCFELRDTFTAYDAYGLAAMNLDGGKLMFRLDPDDPASGETITWCSEAINDLLTYDLPAFLEPLMVRPVDGKPVVVKEAGELARLSGVAAALGRSSRGTWLKLPYCPGYDHVARASTCPILMLGGEAASDPRPLLADLRAGMAAGPNVRGALIGRNVLYPGAGDPLALAAAVRAVVFDGANPEAALAAGAEVAARAGSLFAEG
jgi:hypothetical protein